MSRTEEVFQPALIGKKIPILVLDHKWHKLFTQAEYSLEIKSMEKEMNSLLKRQGKVNTESKEIKKKERIDEPYNEEEGKNTSRYYVSYKVPKEDFKKKLRRFYKDTIR